MQKIENLLKNLRAKKLTVGFAESCTGGLVSALVTALPGVSDTYMGSVVSYSNESKQNLLHVPNEVLKNHGAVSEEAALWMARGACEVLKVTSSAAITGVAGPSGGSEAKPVGTICFAVKGPTFERTTKQFFQGTRQEIQEQAANYAIEFLTNSLN